MRSLRDKKKEFRLKPGGSSCCEEEIRESFKAATQARRFLQVFVNVKSRSAITREASAATGKSAAAAILLRLIFIPPHNVAHSRPSQWGPTVNGRYAVIYDTTSLFSEEGGEKKWNKGVKNASSTPVTVSAAVCEVTRPSGTSRSLFFFHPLAACLLCSESGPFCAPPAFAGPRCVKDRDGFLAALGLARSQAPFVFRAPMRERERERGCGRKRAS